MGVACALPAIATAALEGRPLDLYLYARSRLSTDRLMIPITCPRRAAGLLDLMQSILIAYRRSQIFKANACLAVSVAGLYAGLQWQSRL